jgi:hypothetical protein
MAHTSNVLDKQGYMHARACTRPRARARTFTFRQIYNTYCFSTATIIRERASVLRYTMYIGCLVGYTMNHSFVNSSVCLTTGPEVLPNRVPHRLLSISSSFSFQYPLVSLRLRISCLQLLPLFLATYMFSLRTYFIRQFLYKMWPIQLAFLIFVVYRVLFRPSLYLILHFSHDWSNWSPSFSGIAF